MGLIEAFKIHQKVVEDKRSDTSALAKKQKVWEDIAKRMAANFPERPKSTTKDLRELWRRIKMKVKKVARVDLICAETLSPDGLEQHGTLLQRPLPGRTQV